MGVTMWDDSYVPFLEPDWFELRTLRTITESQSPVLRGVSTITEDGFHPEWDYTIKPRQLLKS
jgi:hypothetical protein